jgi:hypothetical protein
MLYESELMGAITLGFGLSIRHKLLFEIYPWLLAILHITKL